MSAQDQLPRPSSPDRDEEYTPTRIAGKRKPRSCGSGEGQDGPGHWVEGTGSERRQRVSRAGRGWYGSVAGGAIILKETNRGRRLCSEKGWPLSGEGPCWITWADPRTRFRCMRRWRRGRVCHSTPEKEHGARARVGVVRTDWVGWGGVPFIGVPRFRKRGGSIRLRGHVVSRFCKTMRIGSGPHIP